MRKPILFLLLKTIRNGVQFLWFGVHVGSRRLTSCAFTNFKECLGRAETTLCEIFGKLLLFTYSVLL